MSDHTFLDPSFKDRTAVSLGKRVKSKLKDLQAPPRRFSACPRPQGETVDRRTRPGMEFNAELVSGDTFMFLLDSLKRTYSTTEDRSVCKLALDRFSGEPSIRRNSLKEFLGVMDKTGLSRCRSYQTLEALSNRSKTGL